MCFNDARKYILAVQNIMPVLREKTTILILPEDQEKLNEGKDIKYG